MFDNVCRTPRERCRRVFESTSAAILPIFLFVTQFHSCRHLQPAHNCLLRQYVTKGPVSAVGNAHEVGVCHAPVWQLDSNLHMCMCKGVCAGGVTTRSWSR